MTRRRTPARPYRADQRRSHGEETTDTNSRTTERANLEKKPSTRLSQEPCLGVKVNSKRPVGRVASQVLVSLELRAVEDQLDGGAGRIGSIEKLEVDELPAAVTLLTSAWTLPVSGSIPANRLSVPWRLYS